MFYILFSCPASTDLFLARKHNRRSEGSGREDGSVEDSNDDKVGLLTSALMEEELEENMPV